MKIWKCMECNNIVLLLKKGTCTPKCCGQEMKELIANDTDGAVEKHVPVVEINKNKVTVTCGEIPHPMEEKHYIEFMIIETNKKTQIHYLNPGEEPKSVFLLEEDEELKKAYAYCNLHGLWSNKE